MKTETLFINPFYRQFDGPITDNRLPPLELINCATMLKQQGRLVRVVDAHIQQWGAADLARRDLDIDPGLVVMGTSPLNTWQCPPKTIEPFFTAARAMKKKFPQALVIGCGPGTCFFLREMLSVCDLVIAGQPEPFFQAVGNPGDKAVLFAAPGAVFLEPSGEMTRVDPVRRADMTAWPCPDYKLLDYRQYRFGVMRDWVVELETSRGCPQLCDFCFQAMTHYQYSHKTVRQVIAEMRYVAAELGGRDIFFADLDMGADQNFLKELLPAMAAEQFPLRWSANFRSGCLNSELLPQLRRAGCQVALIGVESADEQFQQAMGKNASLAQLRQRIALAQKHGLEVAGYFMIGLPAEDESRINATVRLAQDLNLDYASFQIQTSYPDPARPGQCKETGGLPQVSAERLAELQSLAYQKFYLRPGYILKKFPLLANPRNLWSHLRVFAQTFQRKTIAVQRGISDAAQTK
ncbi:MAG: radical SAM protein [Candidatus Omnitrophica bacterium]|nr:radical SAM protein [Candidatus Omnitrophota bacterium]